MTAIGGFSRYEGKYGNGHSSKLAIERGYHHMAKQCTIDAHDASLAAFGRHFFKDIIQGIYKP
jgi:hypothetical protein